MTSELSRGSETGPGPVTREWAPSSGRHAATESKPSIGDAERGGHLGSVGWAIFFIWIGIAMLSGLVWGWFLFGAGIIALAVQFGRWRIGAGVEKFWIAGGIVFLAGGAWQLLDIQWPLAPFLLILLGVALLAKTVTDATR